MWMLAGMQIWARVLLGWLHGTLRGIFLGAGRYPVKARSVAMAAVLAIKHGCKLRHQLGWNSLIIEFDSFDAISCLPDSLLKGRWDAFPILL